MTVHISAKVSSFKDRFLNSFILFFDFTEPKFQTDIYYALTIN